MEEVYLNGDLEQGAPNILNVSFNYVEGESLIMALKDLAVSPVLPVLPQALSHPTCCARWV
jgi:cysteine sulfinate desulfinase/cysteine desulfurase-like protein